MDTGLLNLGEEHFSTCYVFEEFEDFDPSSLNDNSRSYFNDWEDERELNGDIGLIPESSSFCEKLTDISDITNSPPSLLYQKLIDWSAYIYIEGVDVVAHEPPIQQSLTCQEELGMVTPEKENFSNADDASNKNFDDNEIKNFDLTSYINENEYVNKSQKKVRAAVKKIDVEAQKYIVDDKMNNETSISNEDVVDVETVFEGDSLPVLEASDAFSLLEQFEASEKPISNKHNDNYSTIYSFSENLVNNIDLDVNKISSSPIEIFEKVPQTPVDIFDDDFKMFETNSNTSEPLTMKNEVNMKQHGISKSPCNGKEESVKDENISVPIKPQENSKQDAKPKQGSDTVETHNYVKSKQILEALPQELIARINESGKRKPITVIPPIPNRKRGTSRSVDSVSQHRSKIQKLASNEQIHIDHDYCASVTPYPKEPQKDSGFQSSEEDDRSVIRNQPTVKTADGKLMVSLLKVNTIRNNSSNNNNCNINQKKKLNLEEYKKRRFINSNTTSQSNSPISSTCSSPLPEDENIKRIKHQEKLMKMAVDLLNTPAKNGKKVDNVPTPKTPKLEEVSPKLVVAKVPSEIVPPPDMEVKTYVSVGTNTDISYISNNKNLLASAQQLEEIKPLLKKVSNKINSNSFITSLIENIPKVTNIAKTSAIVISEDQEPVREDKIIHYLKKDREPAKTNSVGAQTDFEIESEETESRYRRRIDTRRSPCSSPSGSSSSSSYGRRRSSSSSRRSRCSRRSDSSSSHSSRVSSRSRSRSVSPKRPRHYSAERLREVEERRVIYVGRIAKGTIKDDLRRRFQHFGPITNISLHFRDYGDNYGFVTFANKEDAYEAVEHGNDGHVYPKYDLSFGGRRIFCKTSYSDLDNMREDDYSYYESRANSESTFDALLRVAQEKLRKRKP